MRVLFVCTGNTCRSPMAEGLLRRMASDEGVDVEVKSAGIAAAEGMPMADHAHTVLQEHDADFDGSSTQVDEELLEWADIVFGMTFTHKQALIETYPQYVDKIHVLKEYVESDPEVEAKVAELYKLYAERELKRSRFLTEHQNELDQLERRLREQPDDEQATEELAKWQRRLAEIVRAEDEQIRQLERDLPNYDIADPFGGPIDAYRDSAEEITDALKALVKKWKTKKL